MTTPPRFNQVNLVVRDIERSLDFYRTAGMQVSAGPEWPPGSGCRHAEVGEDATLEWDNEQFLRVWAPEVEASVGPVIGLTFASAQEVDEAFARLVDAGHQALQSPYDAFWGARYAIVQDPDGHAVGLMGPKSPERRYVPDA